MRIVKFMSRTGADPPGTPTDNETGTAPVLFDAKVRSTAHTPEMEPASAAPPTTDAPGPPTIFAETGTVNGSPGLALIPPVTACPVTPRPCRKTRTADPLPAGFEHEFREPSLLNDTGSGPPE